MLKRVMSLMMILIMVPAILTGCWDKVEIDQRGFVTVIMIDMAPPGYTEKETEAAKDIPGASSQMGKFLKVTYAIANAILFAGEGGGGSEKARVSMSSVSTSIDKASRFVDSRLSRRLYFGHTQVAIFGEEFLKNPDKVKEVLGDIERSQQFSRTIRVLSCEGEASKAADLDPKGEKLLFRYLRGIMENEATNGRIIDLSFNEFISMLAEEKGTGIIPRVSVEKDEVKISGIDIIKDYKLIGSLSEYDALYFNTLSGRRKGGVIYINAGDTALAFSTNNVSRQVKLVNSDPNKLEVEIDVEVEGSISDSKVDQEVFDIDLINKAEKELNKSDEESCKFVISKLQKKYNVDVLQIDEFLRKYHPDVWDKVKDRWSEIYPEIKITPVISDKIRRVGTAK